MEDYIWGSLKDVAFSYDNYQNPTGVVAIGADNACKDGVTYNLTGQKVGGSYKGIVIINGRKRMQK